MLLSNDALTDDVNFNANSSSASITTATTSTTSTTHILQVSIPQFHSNLNTLNNDAINESSKNSVGKCQMEITKKSMPTRFPVYTASEAKQTLHFPSNICTSNSKGRLENENFLCTYNARKNSIEEVDNSFKNFQKGLLESETLIDDYTKFPTLNDKLTRGCRKFPVSKQYRNFRPSIVVKKESLGFQISSFLNDLNLPQVFAAVVSLPKNITDLPTIISPTNLFTHATDLAMAAATIDERMERNKYELYRPRQEAQVHFEQVQYNDQERRARNNNGNVAAPNDGADDHVIKFMLNKLNQPTGKTITMDKNSNLENGNSNTLRKKFMNVCGGCTTERIFDQTNTHNMKNDGTLLAKKEQIVYINGSANSTYNVPLIYDYNNASEIFDIQPNLAGCNYRTSLFPHRQYYSDVRDTSSEEVLADKAILSCQCETCPKIKVSTLDIPTARQSSKSSFSLDVLTSLAVVATPSAASANIYDKFPNLELLPKYYALELLESNERNWTKNSAAAALDKWAVDSDNNAKKESKTKVESIKSDVKSEQKLNAPLKIELYTLNKTNDYNNRARKQQLRRTLSEMTLTQLEEHEDRRTNLSSSEPPPSVLSLYGEQLLSGRTKATFDEMKFEMRATKAVTPQSSLNERFKPTTSSPTDSIKRNQNKSAESLPKTSLTRSQSTLVAANVPQTGESFRRSENISPRFSALSSTSHIKETSPRRENKLNRPPSIDTVDAVLPTRTLLRRQRRMGSQDSVGKEEDPIERLNRLRARISGALSEVKGVLNKYSIENDSPNESTPTSTEQPKKSEPQETNDGPVQFRFVRKVRRRSVFLDEDESAAKSEDKAKLEDHKSPQEIIHFNDEQDTSKTKLPEENKQSIVKQVENWKRIDFVNEITNSENHKARKLATDSLEKKPQIQTIEKVNATIRHLTKDKVALEPQRGPKKQQDGENKSCREKAVDYQILTTREMKKNDENAKVDIESCKAETIVKLEEDPLKQPEPKIEKETASNLNQKVTKKKNYSAPKMEPKVVGNEKQQAKIAFVDTKKEEKRKEKLPEIEKITVQKVQRGDVEIRSNNEVQKMYNNTSKILPEIEIIQPECGLQECTEDNASKYGLQNEKQLDKLIIIDPKEITRRASTGTIKETTVNAVLELQNYKTQRRPSDSAAVAHPPMEKKRKEFKTGKKAICADLSVDLNFAADDLCQKISTPDTEPESVALENLDLANNIYKKPKKRVTLNHDNSLRRFSIAAVQTSKNQPPLQEHKILKVKTQRRASDATTNIAEKPTSTAKSKLITRRPTPRVKIGAKAKRSSVIQNDSSTSTALAAVDESMRATTSIAIEHIKDEIASIQKPGNETSIKVTNDAPASTSHKLLAAQYKVSTSLPSNLSLSPSVLLSSSLPAVIDSSTKTCFNTVLVDTIKNSPNYFTKTNGQRVPIATKLPTSSVQSDKPSSRKSQAIDSLSVGNFAFPEKGTSAIINSVVSSNELINQELATPENPSTTISADLTESQIDDSKEPIYQQQEKIPAPSHLNQRVQQVAVNAGFDALGSVPEIESKASRDQQPESEIESTSESVAPAAVVIAAAAFSSQLSKDAAATRTACVAVESSSCAQTITTASERATTEIVQRSDEKMPELQVLPVPVKVVQITPDNRKFAPLNLPREELPRKKIVFKKIVRQKSIEKPLIVNKKPTSDLCATTKISNEINLSTVEDKIQNESDPIDSQKVSEIHISDEPPAPVKKPRTVKKKVVIKRQQRRLSVSDQTFFNSENTNDQQEYHSKPITETLEKAISYVTDDDDEDEKSKESEPPMPIKGCMRQREFEVGDLVMYAERYKRTQVRWKKGRVLERITSISYKLEIDGKEVPAHISYIKRYTDRKVSFGGKEYLEIDYEQITEEDEKARSYSIWNMV